MPALPLTMHQIRELIFERDSLTTVGLNDKKMIEMAAVEEFRLLRRKLGHAEDYP